MSNNYGDDSHHPSGLVTSEKDCFFLGHKENTTVHLAYSFEPFEGLSVVAEKPSPPDPNFQVASILSDMNYWKGRFIDNEGVMPLWSYAMGGTTTVTLVITHNETLTTTKRSRASGRSARNFSFNTSRPRTPLRPAPREISPSAKPAAPRLTYRRGSVSLQNFTR